MATAKGIEILPENVRVINIEDGIVNLMIDLSTLWECVISRYNTLFVRGTVILPIKNGVNTALASVDASNIFEMAVIQERQINLQVKYPGSLVVDSERGILGEAQVLVYNVSTR